MVIRQLPLLVVEQQLVTAALDAEILNLTWNVTASYPLCTSFPPCQVVSFQVGSLWSTLIPADYQS